MAMYTVKDPEGNLRYLQGPEGASDEEVISQAKIAFPARPKQEENPHPIGWVEQGGRVLQDVGRGALKTVAGMTAGMAKAFSTERDGLMPKEGHSNDAFVNSVLEAPERIAPTPKGDSPARQYARAGLEGAGGSFFGPGGMVRPFASMITGGLAGLGSHAGDKLTDGNPLGAIGGGLLGGFLGGVGTAAHSTRPQMIRQTLEGVKPDDLETGIRNMEGAKRLGLNINLSQGMEQPSNIDATVNRLANSRHGTQTIETLRQQPGKLSMEAERELGSLPGDIRSSQVNANNAQEAADEVIRAGQRRATAAWQAQSPQGSQLQPQTLQALDAKLAALADKYPNHSAGDLIQDARQALLNPRPQPPQGPQILGANGLPINPPSQPMKYLSDALEVKAALDDKLNTFGSRVLNTTAHDAKLQRAAQEVRAEFQKVLDVDAPRVGAANRAYSAVMENEVEPLKKSVLGRVAGRHGADSTIEAPTAKLETLLNRPAVPGAKNSDILDLEKELRTVNNGAEVFQDIARTHLSAKLTKATAPVEGRQSPDLAGNLEAAFGRENLKNTRDLLVGVARSQGLKDEQTYANGFLNLLRYAGLAARRPGVTQGVTEADLNAASTVAGARAVAGLSVTRPWSQPARSLNEWLSKDAHTFMDQLLNTPEGARTLQKMGKQNWMSNAARGTVDTFLATLSQNPAPVIPE